VTARTSSFQFKRRNEDLRVIGEKLNVATVLEGSVRKQGSRVRVTTQIIKVSDGFQLWSESYDRELNDIFSVQEEIARSKARHESTASEWAVAFNLPAFQRGRPTPNSHVVLYSICNRSSGSILSGYLKPRIANAESAAQELNSIPASGSHDSRRVNISGQTELPKPTNMRT
jgi:hypothetical protein